MENTLNVDLEQVARDVGLPIEKVQPTVDLLDDGNTVPFITRYRKDQTGGLDEEQIRQVQQTLAKLHALDDRKQRVLKSLQSQGKLTDELANRINRANSLRRLEDLYQPFKPKKQTLASIARGRGLEPLAGEIVNGDPATTDLQTRAAEFVSEEKDLPTVADVLQGVRHLIAERFSENLQLRDGLRTILRNTGVVVSTRIEEPPAAEKEKAAPQQAEAETEPASQDETSAGSKSGPPESKSENEEAQSSETESPDLAAAGEAPAEPASAESEPLPTTEDETAQSTEPSSTEATVGEQSSAEAPSPEPQPLAAEPQTEPDSSAEPAPDASGGQGAKASEESAKASEEDNAKSVGEGGLEAATEAPPEDTTEATPDASEESESVASSKETGTPEKKPAAPDPLAKAVSKANVKQIAAQQRKEAKKRKRQKKIESFKDYFDYKEPLSKIPPHRLLALNRGERSKIIRVKIDADMEAINAKAEQMLVPPDHPHAEFLRGCVRDTLTRLVLPSLEREVRREITERAEAHAVKVFARNLRKLLLQPPVPNRRVLAVDPGFRSGCKLAALDEFGNVLGHTVIHVIGKAEVVRRGRQQVVEMITMYGIPVITIGNGTACRETEKLIADILAKELKEHDVQYVIVNEAGASVYSTSALGREELPKFDPVLRSAVSIGRRLQDPLSELVKINPANIGVGLYQHDVKAKHLEESLDAVVESCVNFVGVDVNTASPSLLRYVSGLNQLTARRLYEHRQQNGPFRNRSQFKDVPGFGEATFVQAAGFLKITGGDNPLDATWIHPESYDVAQQAIERLGGSVSDLAASVAGVDTEPTEKGKKEPEPATTAVEEQTPQAPAEEPMPQDEVKEEAPAQETTEEPAPAQETTEEAAPTQETTEEPPAAQETTADTAPVQEATEETAPAEEGTDESASPQDEPIDTAEAQPAPAKAADTSGGGQEDTPQPLSLAERAAGADVATLANDLSVGELLLKDILGSLTRPGRDPREDLPPPAFRREIMKLEDLKPGMEMTGTVLNVVDFGAFVDIGLPDSGLIHISRLADRYVRDPHEVVSVGDIVGVWVVEVDKQRRRVSLTAIKPGTETPPEQRKDKPKTGGRDRRHRKPEGKPRGRRAEGRQQGKRGRYGKQRPQQRGPKPKPKPIRPITQEMVEGKEPMRSFSDLLQFYDKKSDGDEKKTNGDEKKPNEDEKKPEDGDPTT